MPFAISWSMPDLSLITPYTQCEIHSPPDFSHFLYFLFSSKVTRSICSVRSCHWRQLISRRSKRCKTDNKVSDGVSELVVFIFTDRYRAPEVLNELRRRDGPWSQDLDRAVAITLDAEGSASVHMSVDLSKREAGGWARIWGTLLNSALFVPLTAGMVEAADEVTLRLWRLSTSSTSDGEESCEARWWRDSLQDSENFKRDLSALITANSSAILMMLRTPKVSEVLENLRNYGSTIVHTTVSTAQDDRLRAMLEGEPAESGLKT